MVTYNPDSPIKIGLGVWRNPKWVGSFYPNGTKPEFMLKTYSQTFNAVEGNTTFHAIPPIERLKSWDTQTPDRFEFAFKFPKSITHRKKLHKTDKEIHHFLNLLAEIQPKVGTIMIQLPPSFDPSLMDRLLRLSNVLPQTFDYAIEFRHPDFFTNPNLEIYDLIRGGIFSLVILDNRLGHSQNPLSKKKNPIVIDPGPNPIVRYVDADGAYDLDRIRAWGRCLKQWEMEGRNPSFFAHTETDNYAPQIGKIIFNELWDTKGNITFESSQLKLF